MAVNVQLQKAEPGTFEQRIQPGMCIGRCVAITEAPTGTYGPNMYWWWEPWYTGDGPKDMIAGAYDTDEHGKTVVYRIRDMTSTRFGKGKTEDTVAKARKRVEALLRREIDDDEPLEGLLDQCIGKSAMLYLVATEQGYINVKYVERYKPGTLAPMPSDSGDMEDEELPFDGGSSAVTEDQPPF